MNRSVNFAIFASVGVLFWVAGFDIIYACLDEGFDRQIGLKSIPARFGCVKALKISFFCHLITISSFLILGISEHLNFYYFSGSAIIILVIFYQHKIISPADLKRANEAAFVANGIISTVFMISVLLNFLI